MCHQSKPHNELYKIDVQHRQGPGHTKTDWTDIRVGLVPKRGRATTERFRPSQHLGVDFKPDDRLVVVVQLHFFSRFLNEFLIAST